MSKNSLEEMTSLYTKKSRGAHPSFSQNEPAPDPQYAHYDIAKLENLKRYNLNQIKNLFPPGKPPIATDRSRSSILDDESQSVQSGTESRFSSNHGQSQHPNSHQSISTSKYWTPSLGPILSRNPIDEEPSAKRGGLMSFRGGDGTSNSTLRTLSKTVGVEKYQHETYFEYTDFDVYVDAMSKRICEADIKSKFNELKHSANLLKLIAEAGPEDDIDHIFSKHMTPDLASIFDSSKPLYKMIAEAGLDQSAIRNIREEQILASKRHSLQESSRPGTQRGDPSSLVLGSAKRKIGVSNYNQVIDSQNKLSDKHESFEAFLLDQGIGAPIYNNKNSTKEIAGSKGNGQHEGHSIGTNGNIQQENNSFSFIKQIDDNASVMHNSQDARGVSSELHMFLMQNLREIMEVKDILRDGIAYGTMESRENLKTSRDERRDNNDPSAIVLQSPEEAQLEQKLQEGQMERLVNKVQALNEKLKKYEQESIEVKRMNQAMKKCLRIGKVKVSDLINNEVDILGLSLDSLPRDYPLQSRYLYVYTNHLSLSNDAAIGGDQEQRLHFSEIEQIYYLEKPGSTYFMLKLLDKETTDKNWGPDSLKLSSQVRAKTIETLSHFYFLEVEDQSEMAAWELAFFVVNFKVLAGNLSFSVNKLDFLQLVRSFIQKYLFTTGETSRSLVIDIGTKTNIQNSVSPQLSRMGTTTSEQLSEKLGIMDIWNRKKLNGNASLQLPAFVKKRSEEGEKIESKEEVSSAATTNPRRTYQKQKSLPTAVRGISAEDDLSSVEEGDSVGEGNPENSPDAREEKNRSHFMKAFSKGSTLELEDDVFSKNLAILMEGVVLSKYGKWGKSHERHVKLSGDLTSLQWMHPLKSNKRRNGIDINTIYSINSGKKSMYFAKKKMSPSELELCFSIVAKARSLHLQAPNIPSRDYFVDALEYILKDKNKLKKVAEQADIKTRK